MTFVSAPLGNPLLRFCNLPVETGECPLYAGIIFRARLPLEFIHRRPNRKVSGVLVLAMGSAIGVAGRISTSTVFRSHPRNTRTVAMVWAGKDGKFIHPLRPCVRRGRVVLRYKRFSESGQQ